MTRTMRAARLTSPGHFEVQEHPVPQPAPGQVLIALARAGLCGGDLQQYKNATGALPFIPGHEGCGIVAEAPGQAALEGQRVVFDPQVHWCGHCEWCGRGHTEICAERRYLGAHAHGTFAQYVVVPSDRVLTLPDAVGWDDAACVHALAGPVFASRRFAHEVGESVLVLGPGAAGLLFVQLAKQCLGASQVMLAGRSAHRLDLGRALGADVAVNTQEEDLAQRVAECTGGRGFDVIIETTGSSPLRQQLPAFGAQRARVLSYATGPIGWDSLKAMAVFGTTGATRSMQPALDLIASGRIRTQQLVTHRYPLERIQEAFDTALSDHKGDFVKGVLSLDP